MANGENTENIKSKQCTKFTTYDDFCIHQLHVLRHPSGSTILPWAVHIWTSQVEVEYLLWGPYQKFWLDNTTQTADGRSGDPVIHWEPVTNRSNRAPVGWSQTSLVSSTKLRHRYRWVYCRKFHAPSVVGSESRYNPRPCAGYQSQSLRLKSSLCSE